MDKDRILAIEDDAGVCRLLRHSLAREDFDLQIVHTGEEGLNATSQTPPSLVLLDLGLPDIDGLEVCRRLKSEPETRHLPIVILTGKGEEADVVSGLEMGADDYITKPFRPRILNARIRAVLRRKTNASNSQIANDDLTIGRLSIFPQNESVSMGDEELELNPAEFRFIHALMRILLSPDELAPENPSTGQEGMTLYAENRLEHLLPILRELQVACPHQHPLLFKFLGLALLLIEPEQAESFLYRSAELFAQNKNSVAELSVLSHLILYHVFLDGNMEKAIELFHKSEQLENPYFDQLCVISRITVAQSQAVGHALLLNNFSRAYEYLSVAEALAEDRGMEHYLTINLLVRAYESYISADTAKLAQAINEALLLLNHPQISTTNKAILKMPQLLYISLTGAFVYFRTIEQFLQSEFDEQLPSTSLPSYLLRLLQAQIAQANAEHEKITGLQSSATDNVLHQPIILGILAMSAALSGEQDRAIDAITATLNRKHRVIFVDLQGQLYCVRALLALGQTAEAAKLLEQVEIQAESTGWTLIEIQALALSLLFYQDRPMTRERLSSLQRLLHEIKVTGIRHLRCLTREDLRALLYTAVNQNIDRPFSIALCRELFKVGFDHDWQPFPLLQFRTLGSLQLSCEDKSLLGSDGFSRSQRACLALLIAAPKNRVDQEEMQLSFWPESHPDKARANLDTMLSRLRKTMQTHIKPLAAKNYLKLQKGIVSLDHCLFDIDELLLALENGKTLLRNRELWQADMAMSQALRLWKGDFIPGACVSNQTIKLADQARQKFIETNLNWAETLIDLGQTSRAITVLNNVLSLDRCNEELISALYRSYMRSNNSTKAGLLLRQYEESMKREDYAPTEIGRLLTQIRSRIAK